MKNLPSVPWRHRWRQPSRTSGLITLLLMLAAAGLGHAGASSLRAWEPVGPAAAQRGQDGAEAALAVAALQRRYGASSYVATRSWQSANALGATIDYMRASGSREFLADLSQTYRAHHDRDGFLNSYYDDEGWWALTWIDAYDLTRNSAYLSQARQIFADMTHGWDSTCSGGIWWSKARRYKNAIANELFLQVAAGLHIRTPGDTAFAAWAAREWAWFLGTGMLTASHLVIDGLADCNPVLSSPAWTYNQGVLIGGLVSLAQITGQGSFLVTAEQTANAVVGSSALSPGGILRDPCEPSSCGLDEPLFKGIFVKNLKRLSDRLGGSYQPYLRHNALAVWSVDRRGDEFGLLWGGPFDSASTARQTSALDVLNTQLTGACLPRRAARTPGHPGRPRSCCWPPGPSGGPGQRAWRPDADGPGPPPRAGRRLPRPGSARRQLGQLEITADIAAGRVPAHRKPAPAPQRTPTLAYRPCRRGSLGG